MSTTTSDDAGVQGALATALRKHWAIVLVEGIILVALGVAAVALPPLATIAVEILIGWLFLLSGAVGLVTTFWMRRAPGFWWALLSAVLGIAVGVVLLRWPLSGAVSLTMVLSVFFLVEGVASIMFAIEHRRAESGRWGWMLVSGIIDVALATIIVMGLPGTAAWAIGLLVGFNLIFGGAALVAMAMHARA
jgi:uncharacterized membrane protein HdeD (DUF308 family)